MKATAPVRTVNYPRYRLCAKRTGVPDMYGGDGPALQDLAVQGGPCHMRAMQRQGEEADQHHHPCQHLSYVQDRAFHRKKLGTRAHLTLLVCHEIKERGDIFLYYFDIITSFYLPRHC